MSDLKERVAIAIWRALRDPNLPCISWEAYPDEEKWYFRRAAPFAIRKALEEAEEVLKRMRWVGYDPTGQQNVAFVRAAAAIAALRGKE